LGIKKLDQVKLSRNFFAYNQFFTISFNVTILRELLSGGWPSVRSRMTTISVLRRDDTMGTDQHEGRALLIFGVSILERSIGLAQEFPSSTVMIGAWNIQGFQHIFEAGVQEPVVAGKFLDAEVMAPKTYSWGK
jgi:hypothetical protein